MWFALLAAIALQPQATESPAPATTPAILHMPIVRRPPDTTPRVAPEGSITIVNSGSTNTAGYRLVVARDGSAQLTMNGETVAKTVPMPQTAWLFDKVTAAMPLENVHAFACMKSASFGTATSIVYRGSTSPDLSCSGDATVRELNRTVGVIAGDLDIRPLPRARPLP